MLEAVPDGGGLPTAELAQLRRTCPSRTTCPISAPPRRLPHPPPAPLDDTPSRSRRSGSTPFRPLKARASVGIALQDLCRDRLGLTSPAPRIGSARPLPDWAPKHCVFRPAPRWDLSNGAASINTANRRRPRAAGSPRTARATPQRCPEAPREDDRHMRYGIVGCGMMGQEHIRNIALLAQAEVSAFVEPDAGMAPRRRRWCRATPCPFDLKACSRATTSTRWSSPRPTTARPAAAGRGRIRPLPVLVEKPHRHAPRGRRALRDLARATPRRSGWRWNTATCRPSRASANWRRRPPAASRC
jgi:hypothetical protein